MNEPLTMNLDQDVEDALNTAFSAAQHVLGRRRDKESIDVESMVNEEPDWVDLSKRLQAMDAENCLEMDRGLSMKCLIW